MSANLSTTSFTPRELVQELDRWIVGQHKAKRAVAIALRSRWRRQQLPAELKEEVSPKNIIMVGPTGVGKTEIARRLSRLAKAPFVKVEATKFTEVGYVGRDVDSMIRDLVEVAISLVKEEQKELVQSRAEAAVEERLLNLLAGPPRKSDGTFEEGEPSATHATRERLRERLRAGKMDERTVELDLADRTGGPMVEVFAGPGFDDFDNSFRDLKDMLGGLMPKRKHTRRLTIAEAREALLAEEADKLIDMETVAREAVARTEQTGIVFIDEIDKIATPDGASRGPDVSRQGVQRDILPIVEGCTVKTKHGMVRTDHILFIAAGAFHVAKPSDLIPELQGRFPLRVELEALTEADFVRILTEPRNALLKQYQALLATEGVEIEFGADAVRRMAAVAAEANSRQENIGARRLHTVLELVLDEINFEAPERQGEKLHVDAGWVDRRVGNILEEQDLARYII